MKINAKDVVLDSFAILAFLNEERGFDVVKRLLRQAGRGQIKLYLNEINAGECYYIIHKTRSKAAAERFLLTLQTLSIELAGNNFHDIIETARIKGDFTLSYADAFVISTARKLNALIYTGDQEFKQVKHLVRIKWI